MTTSRLTLPARLIAALVLTAVVAHAAPGSRAWFVRPFVSYVGATDKDYSDSAGFGAAIGTALGAERADELAFEASGFYYNLNSPYGGKIGDQTFVPTLLTYRHYFAPVSAAARFYVGAGAGFTEVYTHIHDSRSGPLAYHIDATDTAFPFTAEGSLGVAVRLSDMITLDVGYRYLHIDSRNFSAGGYTIGAGAFDAHMAYAGVAIRW